MRLLIDHFLLLTAIDYFLLLVQYVEIRHTDPRIPSNWHGRLGPYWSTVSDYVCRQVGESNQLYVRCIALYILILRCILGAAAIQVKSHTHQSCTPSTQYTVWCGGCAILDS